MKKFDILANTLVYALYMVISCVLVMLAEVLAVKVINLFVVTQYFELTVIRAMIYFVGVNAILAAAAYREGYRAASFPVLSTIITGVLATLLHLIYAFIFSFQAFSAGGVRFFTALIRFGKDLQSNTLMETLDRFDFLPYFLLNSLVYIAIMIAFGKIGAIKRLEHRSEITQKSETPDKGRHRHTKGKI